MSITLTLKKQPNVPLEAESISPDVMAALSPGEVAALPVYLGKKQCRLDEFFVVEGSPLTPNPSPPEGRGEQSAGASPTSREGGCDIELRGDLARVKWLGKAMSRGRLKIVGNAGMHLGSGMKGGTIEVTGNASDWVGAEMTGGLIRIAGNSGGQVGAAYRGSLAGMNGGTILIGGSAGLEVGMRMKRGVIVVGGVARDFCGLQMKGGTIFLLSGAEIRTGAWMFRGTIVSLRPLKLLPTFAAASCSVPTFLRIYAKHLQKLGVAIPVEPACGKYQRFSGDSAVPGKGEILVWQPSD